MTRVVWSLCTEACLDWKQWDDDVVIFHENSGNTHCLNLFAATVLKLLVAGPATTEQLARAVSTRLSIPYDPQVCSSVNAMLAELKSLGITQAAAA